MPKQLLEINKFMSGTVTTPDTTDTPEQSATFSLNLDCVNKDGTLQGAPANRLKKVYVDSAAQSPDVDKATVLKTIASDGSVKEDLVYWEDDANKINLITDVQANATIASGDIADTSSKFNSQGKFNLGSNNSGITYSSVDLKNVAMESHNKEVHIGLGNTVSNKPQWVGYTNHSQFNNKISSVIAVDAEVSYPSSVPPLKKVVKAADEQYVYGVRDGGTRIWKVSSYDGSFVAKSDAGTFANLQSIATDGAGNLYVLDRQTTSAAGSYVYKIATSALSTKVETFGLPVTYPGPSGTNYTDIEYTNPSSTKYIWVAAHWDGIISGGVNDQLLWNFVDDGTSETKALTNRMPRLTGGSAVSGSTVLGTWVNVVVESGTVNSGHFSDTPTRIAETYPRSLVKHPSDGGAIYWLARYPNYVSDNGVNVHVSEYLYLNKDTNLIPGSGDNLDKIRAVTEVRTLCLHRISNTHTAGNSAPLTSVYHPSNADSGSHPFSAANITSIGIEPNTGDVFLTAGSTIQRMGTVIDTSFDAVDETSGLFNLRNLGAKVETTYDVTTGSIQREDVDVVLGFQPTTSSSSWAADTASFALLRQSGTAGFDKVAKEFAAGVSQTFMVDHSIISADTSSPGADSSNSGDLQANYGYWYKFSLLYDGYQETPLCVETFAFDQGNDAYNRQSTITINDTSSLPERASAIKVYRAESPSNSATIPVSLYRLVKYLSLDGPWTLATSGGIESATITLTDKGVKGASYEASSGLSETIENTMPHYSLSAQLNNQHYVGKAYHPNISDATSYIFASKVGKFDVFDWVVDFIKLPTVPTALIGFSGRLYAFDETNMYKLVGGIGENSMYIEDIFEGVGCLNDDAIVATDFGLFFADNQNIYHLTQTAEPIGEAIVRGATTSWQSRDTSYHTRAVYDAKRRSVYFTFKAGNNYYAWAWNIPRKRWDLLSFDDVEGVLEPKGTYTTNDGAVYMGSYNSSGGARKIKHFLGHATDKRIWEWVSKDLTMGNDTQEKNIKSILVPVELNVGYTTNGTKPSSYTNLTGTTAVKSTYRKSVNGKHLKIRVGIKPTQGAKASTIDECGALSVLYKSKRSPR